MRWVKDPISDCSPGYWWPESVLLGNFLLCCAELKYTAGKSQKNNQTKKKKKSELYLRYLVLSVPYVRHQGWPGSGQGALAVGLGKGNDKTQWILGRGQGVLCI